MSAPGITWITRDGIYYSGGLSFEPQVLCFSKPFELGDTQMSDFKVGDVVRLVGTSTRGRVVEQQPHGWVVDIEGHGRHFYAPVNLSLVSRPGDPLASYPKPAFKVGDRVEITWGGYKGEPDTIVGSRDGAGWMLNAREGFYGSHELELLPPETATQAVDREFEWRNKRPEYRYELDVMRYMLQPVLKIDPELVKWMYPEDIKPGVVVFYNEDPSDGWMPAGTYVPLGNHGPKMTSQEQVKAHEMIRRATKSLIRPCPPEWHPDERGAGISKIISHYERRFSSRVATWDPYSEFDLLPDAE